MFLIGTVCTLIFCIFPVLFILVETSVSSIFSYGWRGYIFFVGVFFFLPLGVCLLIASSNFFLQGCSLIALSALFTIPLRILRKEIFQEAKSVETRKIEEYEEMQRRRAKVDRVADFLVEKSIEVVINQSISFCAGLFSMHVPRSSKFSFGNINMENIQQESLKEAFQKVVKRRKKVSFTKAEIVPSLLTLASLIILFHSVYNVPHPTSTTSSARLNSSSIEHLDSTATVQISETECAKLLQAANLIDTVDSSISSTNQSSTENLIASIQTIINTNSSLAKKLSNLGLEDTRLVDAQRDLLKLSSKIYMVQYNKLRAIAQLKKSSSKAERSLLVEEYRRIERQDYELIEKYTGFLTKIKDICSIEN